MAKLIVLVGPPCAGKSTWAKSYIKKNSNTARLNRDDFRYMMVGQPVAERNMENSITTMINEGIIDLLSHGVDVIVDQTCCKYKYIFNFQCLAKSCNAEIECVVFDVELAELKKRSQIRAIGSGFKPVSDAVIETMYNNFVHLKNTFDFKKMEMK